MNKGDIDKFVASDGKIRLKGTIEADLGRILEMEQGEENRLYVRQWSLQQHRTALTSSNQAHLTIFRAEDDRIVGYAILIGLDDPDGNLEFKRLVIDRKGDGYGRAAFRLVTKVAFERLETHRLWLEVMETNHRAFRLYGTEGYVLEGFHRESYRQGENYTTLRVMSMLRREYQRHRQIRHCREATNSSRFLSGC